MSFTLCLEFGKLSASLTRQGQGQSGGARASLGCQSKSGVPGPIGACQNQSEVPTPIWGARINLECQCQSEVQREV